MSNKASEPGDQRIEQAQTLPFLSAMDYHTPVQYA